VVGVLKGAVKWIAVVCLVVTMVAVAVGWKGFLDRKATEWSYQDGIQQVEGLGIAGDAEIIDPTR